MKAYFSEESMRFLRGLKRNNDRVWFAERKHIYERAVKAPMKLLIAEINESMAEFAPELARPAEKVIRKIHRDIRFAHDKSPFKIHQAAWWAPEGMPRTSGGGFYLSVNAERMVIAAGMFMPDVTQLLPVRRMLMERHAEFRVAMKAAMRRGLMTEREGDPLTRSRKGFPAEHPAADLFRQKRWGVSIELPSGLALEPRLVREVVRRFRAAAPMIALLNAPIAKRRKPLFGLE